MATMMNAVASHRHMYPQRDLSRGQVMASPIGKAIPMRPAFA